MMPEVSVIIPTYNNEKYIIQSLDSIITQTFLDYEIIIIDDGSTDETKKLLKPYMHKINYYYQENQGLAVARNVGLEKAKGKFVTYLDGDDIWNHDNLKIKYDILSKQKELGGVFSDFRIFNSSGTIYASGIKKLFPFFNRTGKDFADIFQYYENLILGQGKETGFYYGNIFNSLFWGNFILPSSMLFRKEYAIQIGHFLPHMRTQQDYEYWLRFSKQFPFGYIDEVFVKYRRHSKQLTDHSNIERIFKAVIEIIDQYQEDFTKNAKKHLFNQRKSELFLSLSKVYLGASKNSLARKNLLKSFRMYPNRLSVCFYWLTSFFPNFLVIKLKNILSRIL